LFVENRHCLIDKDSGQPAAKSTFMVKPWSTIGGYPYAVLHGIFGLMVVAEHAVGDQSENATIPRQQII
jgi:hypothetical protein